MPIVHLPSLTVDDALDRIVRWMRNPRRSLNSTNRDPIARYINLREVMEPLFALEQGRLAAEQRGITSFQYDYDKNAGPFHTAAWELVRRGVLRPMPQADRNGQVMPQLFGWMFATTEYGLRWLASLSGDEAIPMEYGRFAELLGGHAQRFGAGYHSRSQEAVQCYRASAYLACCAMCGAAAESILLSIATTRSGDESSVLSVYRGSGGRGRVERQVTGQLSQQHQASFASYLDLLKYWRDDSAHGRAVNFDEEEAFMAMLLLLRFGRFADREWQQLTAPASS